MMQPMFRRGFQTSIIWPVVQRYCQAVVDDPNRGHSPTCTSISLEGTERGCPASPECECLAPPVPDCRSSPNEIECDARNDVEQKDAYLVDRNPA